MNNIRWLLRKQQLPGWAVIGWTLLVILREVVSFAGDVQFATSANWGWRTPLNALTNPLALLLLILLGLSWLVLVGPRLYLRDSYIRGEKVYLADLIKHVASDSPMIIKDKVLEDCDINGPAVLIHTQADFNFMTACQFDGLMDEVFIPVDASRSMVGVIGLQNVVMKKCRLKRVSIVGTPQMIAAWKRSNVEERRTT